jgi:hypothetical protein
LKVIVEAPALEVRLAFSPFRSGVEIEDCQFTPVNRTRTILRVNGLITNVLGLGNI